MGLHAYILLNESYFLSLDICLLACYILQLHKDNVMFIYYYFLTVWMKIKEDYY